MEALRRLLSEGVAHVVGTFNPNSAYGAPALCGALIVALGWFAWRRRARGREVSLKSFPARDVPAPHPHASVVLGRRAAVDAQHHRVRLRLRLAGGRQFLLARPYAGGADAQLRRLFRSARAFRRRHVRRDIGRVVGVRVRLLVLPLRVSPHSRPVGVPQGASFGGSDDDPDRDASAPHRDHRFHECAGPLHGSGLRTDDVSIRSRRSLGAARRQHRSGNLHPDLGPSAP